MRPSMILDTVTRAAFPLVLTFSLYLLFVGHNAPGGGFVGGLTAGIAFVIVYLGGGKERLGQVVGFRYETLLAAGLVLACGTALSSLLLGEPLLSSAILEWDLLLLGKVKIVTVLFFDIGVYLIVVGLALALLTVLGTYRVEGTRADADRDGGGHDVAGVGGVAVSSDGARSDGRGSGGRDRTTPTREARP